MKNENTIEVGARVTLYHTNGKKYKALIFAINNEKEEGVVDLAVYPNPFGFNLLKNFVPLTTSFDILKDVRRNPFPSLKGAPTQNLWDFKKKKKWYQY